MASKFVNGTSGQPDYLVIAQSGNCVAAIKAEVHVSKGVGCGVRVRVCLDPDKSDYKGLSVTEIMQAFPNCPLPILDATRGSIPLYVAKPESQPHKLISLLESMTTDKNVIMAFATRITKLLAPHETMPIAEMADYIQRKWSQAAIAHGASMTNTSTNDVEKAIGSELDKLLSSFKFDGSTG